MFITIQRFVVNNLNQHAEMQQEIACTNVRLHIIIYILVILLLSFGLNIILYT